MSYISPGFPASGADSAPLVVEPSGKVDVLYQGYQVTNKKTYALGPGYSYFTSSPNHGNTWSTPVKVGASAGTMSTTEWWIDGDIGIDAGGSLYATWDTQGPSNDIGWVSYSTDGGQNWSAPIQAPADVTNAPHIVEVAGGPSGIAYVGWLSDSSPSGYAEYLRTFSTVDGESWLSPPQQVSSQFGTRPCGARGHLRHLDPLADRCASELGQRHAVDRSGLRDLRGPGLGYAPVTLSTVLQSSCRSTRLAPPGLAHARRPSAGPAEPDSGPSWRAGSRARQTGPRR